MTDSDGDFFAIVGDDGTLRRLRSDWLDVVTDGRRVADGGKVLGYIYHPGGRGSDREEVLFRREEVVREAADAAPRRIKYGGVPAEPSDPRFAKVRAQLEALRRSNRESMRLINDYVDKYVRRGR